MRELIAILLLVSVVLLAACSGVDDRTAINTGAGAAIGATAGAVIGNNLERDGREGGGSTGALVGAIAGGLIGYSASQNGSAYDDEYSSGGGFYGDDGRYYIYRDGVAVPAAPPAYPPAESYYDDRRYYAPRDSSMRLSY